MGLFFDEKKILANTKKLSVQSKHKDNSIDMVKLSVKSKIRGKSFADIDQTLLSGKTPSSGKKDDTTSKIEPKINYIGDN